MVPTDPDIIFTGRFGSGKSEIALNYAVQVAKQQRREIGHRPILVDLDLVTPYFRSREAVKAMNAAGVQVIAPLALSQAIDVPAVVPEILGAIQQTDRPVILDVGGDEQGARALGQYSSALQKRGYAMYFVVNPYRPLSATPEAICSSIAEIERSSRLRVAALVSNPNLMHETDPDTIMAGHAIVEEASQLASRPIAFLVITQPLAARLPQGWLVGKFLALHRYFTLPWEIEGEESRGAHPSILTLTNLSEMGEP
jgi:hypothetical protein